MESIGESVPDLPERETAQLRFLVNDIPLRNTRLSVYYPDSCSVPRGTDESGEVKVCIDLERVSPDPEFSALSGRMQSPKDLYFVQEGAMPRKAAELVEVRLETGSFRLFFQTETGTGDGMRVDLKALDTESKALGNFEWPGGEMLEFPRLGTGTYQVILHRAGAARWDSGPIEITRAGAELDVDWEPGADLRFDLSVPKGRSELIRPKVQLLDDRGNPLRDFFYGYGSTTYRGLPVGRYLVRILSSAESRRDLERAYGGPLLDRSGPFWEGREVPVEIHASSPPSIDLGTIDLGEQPRSSN